MFTLPDCDLGFMIRGTRYDFEHVDAVQFEDPRSVKLTRGANEKDKVGLVYVEGGKDPERATIPVMNLSKELFELLVDVHGKKERFDFFCISRTTGAKKSAANAILTQKPQQLNIGADAESLAIQLIIESFDMGEKQKA